MCLDEGGGTLLPAADLLKCRVARLWADRVVCECARDVDDRSDVGVRRQRARDVLYSTEDGFIGSGLKFYTKNTPKSISNSIHKLRYL